ncbi:MAG TPA: hypothetical protein VHA78_04080 [Candidatus Peribacteraceae bacterium]|nr:hypothetical protein [Candidatus Peribacteraceae bacterium]
MADDKAKKSANDARRIAKSIRSAARSKAWEANRRTLREAVTAAIEETDSQKKK